MKTLLAAGWTEEDAEFLSQRRKYYIKQREEYLASQKTHGKDDREAARWCSDQAKYWLGMEKAVTLAISYIRCLPSYDEVFMPFPKELDAQVYHELGCALYKIPLNPSKDDDAQ